MISAHVTHWLSMALEHGIFFFYMIHEECKLFFSWFKSKGISTPWMTFNM